MIVGNRAFAAARRQHRGVEELGYLLQLVPRARVDDAAAGPDQRSLGVAQERGRPLDVPRVATGACMGLARENLDGSFALKDVERNLHHRRPRAVDFHAAHCLVDGAGDLPGGHGLPTPLRQAAEHAELILALVDQPLVLVEKRRKILRHDVEQGDAVAVGLTHGRGHVERARSGGA